MSWHDVVHQKDNQALLAIIDSGVIVDELINGHRALDIAAQKGSVDCMLSLLNANANPNMKDWLGYMPLDYVISDHKLECVKVICIYIIITTNNSLRLWLNIKRLLMRIILTIYRFTSLPQMDTTFV